MTSAKDRIEVIREENLSQIPDSSCPCGRPQVRDLFGLPWPECLYFDDKTICEGRVSLSD